MMEKISWRENTQKAFERVDNWMKKSHEKKNSCKLYEKGDKFFVKREKRRDRKSTRNRILVAVNIFVKRFLKKPLRFITKRVKNYYKTRQLFYYKTRQFNYKMW